MKKTSNEKFPTGFTYFANFLSQDEEKLLIAHIKKLPWESVSLHGVTAKRTVVHFGYRYNYAKRSIISTVPPPLFLKPYLIRAAEMLHIDPQNIPEVLVTQYPPGAGIGWHKDALVFDKIFGISLGANCTFKLRIQKNGKYVIVKKELTGGSAYILQKEARLAWQHSILPVKGARYSITLRTIKKLEQNNK